MSKFLKLIVTLILIVFIGSGAALILPQFVGDLDTIIVQENMISNRPVGTVLYTHRESSVDLQIGDKIVDMEADSLYIHEVVSYDSVSQTAQVTGGTATTIRLGENYTRVVFSVPLIGFLTIATQSVPGLILLGLILGLVILLFIASEVLRRHDDDDEDDEDDAYPTHRSDDDDFYAGLAQRKRETESLGSIRDSLAESTATESTEFEEGVLAEAPQGLFTEVTDTPAAVEAPMAEQPNTAEEASQFTDGMLELSKDAPAAEEAAPGAVEKPLGTGELPDVQAALEAALENQQLNHERPKGVSRPIAERVLEEEAVVPNEAGEIELAMPVHTKDELLSKAYADGLDPVVREDAQNGVTFIDYTDCL